MIEQWRILMDFVLSARILRCLCSIGVFAEVAADWFANNRISAALVSNEPLRAYIMMLYVVWNLQQPLCLIPGLPSQTRCPVFLVS